MLNANLSRGERSRLHTSMLKAMGVPIGAPETREESIRQAYAECASLVESPGDAMRLSQEIEIHADAIVFKSGVNCAIIDPAPLAKVCPSDVLDVALRLAGYRLQTGVWTDAERPNDRTHAAHVRLPVDLWDGDQ